MFCLLLLLLLFIPEEFAHWYEDCTLRRSQHSPSKKDQQHQVECLQGEVEALQTELKTMEIQLRDRDKNLTDSGNKIREMEVYR